MDFLLGVVALVVGAAVALAGLRLFFVLLPVWGAVVGFLAGAAGVSAVFGDGFLATTLGIVVGLVVAVGFAIFSYLYWYVGVVLAAGAFGSVLATALFASFGVDSSWLLFFIGLIGAALLAFLTIVLRAPVILVVVNTALAGSAIAIGGLLLVLDRVDREELGTGALWQRINDNWLLWILWLVGAAIGLGAQFSTMQQAALPDDRWTRAEPLAAA